MTGDTLQSRLARAYGLFMLAAGVALAIGTFPSWMSVPDHPWTVAVRDNPSPRIPLLRLLEIDPDTQAVPAHHWWVLAAVTGAYLVACGLLLAVTRATRLGHTLRSDSLAVPSAGTGSAGPSGVSSNEVPGTDLWDRLWNSPWHWAALAVTWLAFSLAAPLITNDLLYYATMARMGVVYGLNPYDSAHLAVAQLDPWGKLISWPFFPAMTYGPVWTTISMGCVWLAGGVGWLELWLLKLPSIAAFMACVWTAHQLLPKTLVQRRGWALLMLWSPLGLIEIGLAGHNDPLMVLGLLWCLLALRRGWVYAAAGCLAVGIGAKYVIALVVPLIVARAYAIRGRLLPVVGPCALAAAVLALCFAPYAWWIGFGVFDGIRTHGEVAFPSVATFLQAIVSIKSNIGWLGKAVAHLVLVAVVCRVAWGVARGDAVEQKIIAVLLGYILLVSNATFPWYFLWLLFLLPMASRAVQVSTWVAVLYMQITTIVFPPLAPAHLTPNMFTAVVWFMVWLVVWLASRQPSERGTGASIA